jgi:protein farnesyltransferase/geranylgeranyltransferase type-1 subunit alpha
VLEHARLPLSTQRQFVEPYAEPREPADPLAPPLSNPAEEVVDLDNPLPSKQAELPVPFAIEFLGDVAEEEDDMDKAVEVQSWFSARGHF